MDNKIGTYINNLCVVSNKQNDCIPKEELYRQMKNRDEKITYKKLHDYLKTELNIRFDQTNFSYRGIAWKDDLSGEY